MDLLWEWCALISTEPSLQLPQFEDSLYFIGISYYSDVSFTDKINIYKYVLPVVQKDFLK